VKHELLLNLRARVSPNILIEITTINSPIGLSSTFDSVVDLISKLGLQLCY